MMQPGRLTAAPACLPLDGLLSCPWVGEIAPRTRGLATHFSWDSMAACDRTSGARIASLETEPGARPAPT